jgi:hypothetical protein
MEHTHEVVILAANGLSGAHATFADTDDIDGAAIRPNKRSNGVNDNAKEAEEDADDASVCLWMVRMFFSRKRNGKFIHSLGFIAAQESSGVALACGRRGWSWRVLETNGEVKSAQRVSRHESIITHGRDGNGLSSRHGSARS